MNRRTFFRNLAIGSVSLPAVAKVAMACDPEALTFAKLKALREDMTARLNPAWENTEYRVDFIIPARSYRGIKFGCDPHPLRFSEK